MVGCFNSPFFRFLASKLGLGQALPRVVEVTVDPGTGIVTPSPAFTNNSRPRFGIENPFFSHGVHCPPFSSNTSIQAS